MFAVICKNKLLEEVFVGSIFIIHMQILFLKKLCKQFIEFAFFILKF